MASRQVRVTRGDAAAFGFRLGCDGNYRFIIRAVDEGRSSSLHRCIIMALLVNPFSHHHHPPLFCPTAQPGSQAGLKPGDIVLAINGTVLPEKSDPSFARKLVKESKNTVDLELAPGDAVSLAAVSRFTERFEITDHTVTRTAVQSHPITPTTAWTMTSNQRQNPNTDSTISKALSAPASGIGENAIQRSPACGCPVIELPPMSAVEPSITALPPAIFPCNEKKAAKEQQPAGKTCRGCTLPVAPSEGYIAVPSISAVYHSGCFQCEACNKSLSHQSSFQLDDHNGKLLCPECWFSVHGKHCANCCDRIVPTGPGHLQIISTGDLSFHALCFVCFTCDAPLMHENEPSLFYPINGRVYCELHSDGDVPSHKQSSVQHFIEI